MRSGGRDFYQAGIISTPSSTVTTTDDAHCTETTSDGTVVMKPPDKRSKAKLTPNFSDRQSARSGAWKLKRPV